MNRIADSLHSMKQATFRWVQRRYEEAERVATRYSPISAETIALISVYISIAALLQWQVDRFFTNAMLDITPHWTAGYAPPTLVYNQSLISYLILAFGAMGLCVIALLLQQMPALRAWLGRALRWVEVPLFVFSLAGIALGGMYVARAMFLAAALGFLPHFIRLLTQPSVPKEIAAARRFLHNRPMAVVALLLLPVGLALTIGARAWFPVQLPNDYYEIHDTVKLTLPPENTLTPVTRMASRTAVIDCLETQRNAVARFLSSSPPDGILNQHLDTHMQSEAEQLAQATPPKTAPTTQPADIKCKLDVSLEELNLLSESIMRTGGWQSQAGRLFYHHSYIFVPAAHFLSYGLDAPIPYMYGIGNTLFHAELMQHITSPTLTGYISSFPIAQLTGFIAIVLLIAYISRNILTTIAASGLMLACAYHMTFEALLMAPGFSPLRYLGLVGQLASIFCLFRGNHFLRRFSLLAALAFSFFWNGEFALIGLVSQSLALFLPQLRLSVVGRFLWLGAAVAVAIGMLSGINYLTRGYLETMHLIVFGLLPALGPFPFVLLVLIVGAITLALISRAHHFTPEERAPRLAVLPIFVLLVTKYLYTISTVHLFYSLMLLAPLALTYFHWSSLRRHTNSTPLQDYWSLLFALVCVSLACVKAVAYYGSADRFHRSMIEPYKTHVWEELGESFITPMPPEVITDRVKAIREEIKPDDAVIFLSPFDHLLSFYANPRHFCGHYELLTNLVTFKQISDVAKCAYETPGDVVVVYDDALEKICPNKWKINYFSQSACGAKALIKQNAQAVLKTLRADLVRKKKVGNLSFYRLKRPAKDAE